MRALAFDEHDGALRRGGKDSSSSSERLDIVDEDVMVRIRDK